jgi:hypothetical protein
MHELAVHSPRSGRPVWGHPTMPPLLEHCFGMLIANFLPQAKLPAAIKAFIRSERHIEEEAVPNLSAIPDCLAFHNN